MVLRCSCCLSFPVRKIKLIKIHFQNKTFIWLIGLQNRNFKPLKNLLSLGGGQGLILLILRKWNLKPSWNPRKCSWQSLRPKSSTHNKSLISPQSPQSPLSFLISVLERPRLEKRCLNTQGFPRYRFVCWAYQQDVNRC